jgi:EmrB/QacA subfamily drug resistance transporter
MDCVKEEKMNPAQADKISSGRDTADAGQPRVESANAVQPGTDRNRKWWILAAMTLALAMISVDQSIAPISLPRIQRELGLQNNALFWVINAYLLTFTVMAAVSGRLSDILGRKKTLLFGVFVFAVSSACSGLAQSAVMLITARAFQGIGAAFLVTASIAIVISTFELEERGKAMAYYNSGAMTMMMIGTVAGGMVTDFCSWRLAYFLTVPIAIIVPAIMFFHRPSDEIIKGQRVDFPGLALLMISMTSIVLSLQQGGSWGWGSGLTVAMLGGGVAAFVVFVLLERRTEEPLINFRLLSNRNFNANVAILGLLQFACIGQGMFGALYLQQILSFSPTVAGGWSLVTLILITISVQWSGRLFDRTGVRLPALAGLACAAFGYLWQAALLPTQNIFWLLPGLAAVGIGIGLLMPAAYTDAMNRIAAAYRGQAAGVIENARQIGATIGIAVCGAMVSALQTVKLEGLLSVFGASPDKAALLQGLLSQTPELQQSKASMISADWQGVMAHLKMAVTYSYSSAYFLAGALMVICVVIAAVSFRKGRQTEEESGDSSGSESLQAALQPAD